MISLALKYRPSDFSDLAGQLHASKSLKNAIEYNRISHAYLFFGSRGVGKTSTARIFAKCLNCRTNGVSINPCGKCENCVEIAEGRNIDVIEMDAASNRGIEHIRDLRENVRFSPMKSKHKIYIIDEVHMLTNEAFNALLKTLEEPPSHTVFILATTEYHKIPETILSRCQSFAFKKFNEADISERLEKILKDESIEYDPKALLPIARKAEGSMRDAVSLLDQTISYCADGRLDEKTVLDILGIIPGDIYSQFLENIRTRNLKTSLELFEKLHNEGHNLKNFLRDFLEFLKNALLIKSAALEKKDAMFLSPSEKEAITEKIAAWETSELLFTFELFFKLYSNWSIFKAASSTEVLVSLEVALVDLFYKLEQPSVSSLVQKLSHLESALQSGKNFEDLKAAPKETPAPAQTAKPALKEPNPLKSKNDIQGSAQPPQTEKTGKTEKPPASQPAEKPENEPYPSNETDFGQILQKEFGGSEAAPDSKLNIFEQ